MSRPANIHRPTTLNTTLPEDLRAKLDLYLYSEVEGRIPKGSYQKFIIERINDFFREREARAAEPQVPEIPFG